MGGTIIEVLRLEDECCVFMRYGRGNVHWTYIEGLGFDVRDGFRVWTALERVGMPRWLWIITGLVVMALLDQTRQRNRDALEILVSPASIWSAACFSWSNSVCVVPGTASKYRICIWRSGGGLDLLVDTQCMASGECT